MSRKTAEAKPSGRTLYLHIGIPKTASSWLQSKVFSELSHLTYFDSPRGHLFQSPEDINDGNWHMASVFKRSSHIWEIYGDPIFSEVFGDKAAWQKLGRDTLISDESIGRQGSRSSLLAGHLAGLRDKAAEWGFDRMKVILLVRRQDTWLASHYAQVSDRNPQAGQRDFEGLLNDVTSPQRSRYGFGALLDYGSLYQAITATVGSEDVLVWPFEHVQEDAAGFLQTLLPSLNTPADEIQAICDAAAGSDANVRSAGQIWRLRHTPSRLRRMASKFLPSRRGPGTIELTDSLSRKVLQAYAAENHKISDRTGLDLRRYGYFR